LASCAKPEGIVVFLHQPLWYNWSSWSRVHKLLAEHSVGAVIAGHFHYNQTETTLDGIHYRVLGATGGKTRTGSPNAGNLQHVTTIKFGSGEPQFTIIPLSPYSWTQPTSRPLNDTLQAIEQSFGSLYDFAAGSPVYLKGTNLVSDCSSGAPATLNLASFGNAAARPVMITLKVQAQNISVTQGKFATDACVDSIGTFQCQLAASKFVAVSNTSIVQISSYPTPPPLWVGTLAAGSTPPVVGTQINMQVTMSFDDGGQNYLLNTNVQTSVQACPVSSAASTVPSPNSGRTGTKSTR